MSRIDQLLDLQFVGQDPFSLAREKAQPQESVQFTNDTFNFQSSPPPPQEAPKQLVTGSTPTQRMDFTKSDLPKMLQNLGIDNKNLAYNDLGRIQLMTRLRNKYGDQYDKNPEALNILSEFDKNISKYQDQRRESLNKTLSTGQRTLAALLG